jgi:Zinc carboxypeptidase
MDNSALRFLLTMIWRSALPTLVGLFAGAAQAQFDLSKIVIEPQSISRQFAEPEATFTTPAFGPGRTDFTTHEQAMVFLERIAKSSTRLSLETMGRSQQERPLVLAVLTGERGFDQHLPTILLLAQQHGNEPASGEAALELVRVLSNERSALLDRANVLIMPRTNPDAAEKFVRESANGLDINRDHLLLRTPEAQAIAAVMQRYSPHVILDLHEFTVAGRWVSKFGAMMRADAMIQAASVGNLSPLILSAQQRYLAAARTALENAGHRVEAYHTSSASAKDLAVAMGGVSADTGRNVGGLRNSVSLLLETRGIGLGRAHLARRVQSHLVSALAIISAAGADGPELVQLQQNAGSTTAGQACRGTIAVSVRQTAMQRRLNFLNAHSGEPLEVEVTWRSSDLLEVERERARPCGYLLGADQSLAVQRLRELGVKVGTLSAGASEQSWDVEDYVVEAEATAERLDARGPIADNQNGIRMLRVKTQLNKQVPAPGSYYVTMNQPLAGLVSAALEPDSQSSFAANRLLNIDAGRLRRVMRLP